MRKGWEYKKLNEVCEKGASNIVINKLTDNSGEYPLFGASGLVKNIDFFHQDKPYIGIVKDGAGVGRVNIYPAYSSLVGTMQYIFPKEGYSIDFIKYFLVKLDLSHCVSGATIPHIYFKDYGKENIPTPSLDTQLAIVSELDKINELIRLKKEQLKDFDNLAQSIFYEMFGDPVENEKGWEVKTLDEVCSAKNGLVDPKEEPYASMYHVGPANILSDTGELINLKLAKDENLISGKYLFNTGMILYSKIRPNLNKVTKATFEGICSADMYPLIPKDNIVSEYLLFILKTKKFLDYAISNSGRANIPKINREALMTYKTILPPLPLQHLFAHRIEQIEHQKAEVQKAITDLETLLASRMQYWFE